LADEDTDVKRQMVEPPLEGAHQVRALSSVGSGQLHALRPLVSERLGPLGELLVVQLPIGRERTPHLPALTAAECEQALGSIPTVKEPVDLETRGQQLLSRRQPLLSQGCFLAKMEAVLRSPFSIETPHGFLAEVEPPIIGIGPRAKC
jgi:hypothetical protein